MGPVRVFSRLRWLLVSMSLSVATVAAAQQRPSSVFAPNWGGIPSPSSTAATPWMEAWTGFGFTNNFHGGYFGAVRALNPTNNVYADGFVVRGEGFVGHYNYHQVSVLHPNPE